MNHPRTDFDVSYMLLALDEGRNAAEKGEVPVGAVVVCEGEVIGRGHNQRETQQSPWPTRKSWRSRRHPAGCAAGA